MILLPGSQHGMEFWWHDWRNIVLEKELVSWRFNESFAWEKVISHSHSSLLHFLLAFFLRNSHFLPFWVFCSGYWCCFRVLTRRLQRVLRQNITTRLYKMWERIKRCVKLIRKSHLLFQDFWIKIMTEDNLTKFWWVFENKAWIYSFKYI